MKRRAFTLMELMIVIVIIGILAAGSLIIFGDKSEKAKEAVAKANFQSVVTSIATEMMECNLGEDKVMGFIKCSLTPEQRKGALVSSANSQKVHDWFDGMHNPFRNDAISKEYSPVWTGVAGDAGQIGISSNAVPNGVFVNSPVSEYQAGTENKLRCSQTPNDTNCLKKFILIE